MPAPSGSDSSPRTTAGPSPYGVQTIVDLEATAEDAVAHGERVAAWLVGEGIVRPADHRPAPLPEFVAERGRTLGHRTASCGDTGSARGRLGADRARSVRVAEGRGAWAPSPTDSDEWGWERGPGTVRCR